jgi:Ca2+-binding RTX toxin-like protein
LTARAIAVTGVVAGMVIAMGGQSFAAGTAAATASAASSSAAGPDRVDPNHTSGDPAEFAGYSGLVDPGSATATSDDSTVDKPGGWTPKGTNGTDNPDVAGQPAANKVPDKVVRQALPSKPNKASVAEIRAALKSDSKAQVTVLMKGTDLSAGMSSQRVAAERADVSAAQADLAQTLAGTGATKVSAAALQPAATYRITSAGLDALLADPSVADITLDGQAGAELASSTAVIQSTQLNQAGTRGDNYSGSTTGPYQVAIIDSGVDNQHNAFTGRIVSQACFVTDNSCLGGTNSSTAAGSADECTHSTDCDHGTHVAGIAAGGAFTGGHEGVAPGARIVAIKVAQDNPSSSRWTAQFSSINNALQRVLTLKNSTNPNIVSVNLSIGTDATFTPAQQATCDATSPTVVASIGQLQNAGVAVDIAAGNNGVAGAMSFPGCATGAFAIGATDDSDVPASFTNSSSGLRWWAPGVDIDSAVPTGNNHASKNGTSMATPHVVGAQALLRQCVDGNGVPLTNTAVANLLDTTGPLVTRSGVTRHRINVLDAATSTVNNNDFANAEVFSGNGPIDDFDFTTCSDTEPGEPSGGFSLDNGIWWYWTPATTGTATISTVDSASFHTTFDTTLAVYTGSTLASLSLLAANDDISGTDRRSQVVIPVNGGTTYRIKVDGFAAATGLLNLHIQNGPPPLCFTTPATIVGTPGNDVINGTAGNDVIVAGAGNDTINGNGGNDTICGDAGNDTINGGDGNDFVLGGSGADRILGGNGDDNLVGNPGFGSNDDTGDTILGEAGNDVLDGWFGDDTLSGGLGNDTIGGWAGVDTATYTPSATAVNASLTSNTATGEGSDTFIGVENLTGSKFSDVLTGDAGANVLNGWEGNDQLDGMAGNDRLIGGNGNDLLRGRTGNDIVAGDAGVDTAAYDTANTGVNVNLTTGTSAGAHGVDAITGVENIRGSSFNDFLTGSAGANVIQGNPGNDVIKGLGGNDTLYGSTGADRLYGGDGNDIVYGGADSDPTVAGENGNDRLFGDAGVETCSGGAGFDVASASCEHTIGVP